MAEFQAKQERIQELLARHGLQALLLQRVSSFAWATCGAASYVNSATTNGPSSLLLTPGRRYLLTNNIERPRLEAEEGLASQGWETQATPWHRAPEAVARLTAGLKLGSDGPYPGAADLSADLARLRARLTPEEGERMRALGRLCAQALESAIRGVRPGQTEFEIAGRLAGEAQSRGVQAVVDLVATDERIFRYRHPLPTEKALERYAMLVLSGRRRGQVVSVTRLVHFGRLPRELRRKAKAVAQVDAALIAATRPGRTLGEVLRRGIEAYERAGYGAEWELHHQGGAVGYESREYLATPGSADAVALGQAYAWNPSITGVKSEDTILVGQVGPEVITAMPGWPTAPMAAEGQVLERPAVLEIG